MSRDYRARAMFPFEEWSQATPVNMGAQWNAQPPRIRRFVRCRFSRDWQR